MAPGCRSSGEVAQGDALSAAMRYRFCPRCTVVVTPDMGVDTETGALPVGARRTTWLLPQPASTRQASASPASAPAFIRTTSCVRMPDKVADGAEQQHRGDPAKRLDPAAQCRLGAGAAERIAPATRYTRLPRPTNMLAMNGNRGTPTMPEAQVKNFRGIGVKPASTRIQNAFHGDSIAISRRYTTCSFILCSQPSSANSGLTSSKA